MLGRWHNDKYIKENRMDSFVYQWTNLTLNKIYIGFHKGTEDDGYICSSSSVTFWEEYHNPLYSWERVILYRGTMSECQILESNLLNNLDITSDSVYNNKNNLMFNLNDEVRAKLKAAALKRGKNPEYREAQSIGAKQAWANDPGRHKRQSDKAKLQVITEVTREKIRTARAKQVITVESREKAAGKLRGIPRSPDVAAAISFTRKNAPVVTCPHCGVEGKLGGSMSRWHFDNCRCK